MMSADENRSFSREDRASAKTMVPIEMEDVSASLPSAEEIRGDIVYASKKNRHLRWIKRGSLTLLIFVVLIVVISTSIGLSKRHAAAASRASTPTLVVDFLTKSGITALTELSIEGSPQNLAARWLAESDPANIPVPVENSPEHEKYRYLVRYVMVVLYYITDGANWHQNLNFLTADDICFWHRAFYIEGVYCNKFSLDPRKMPVFLSINGNNLNGRIPAELGRLSALRTISLQNNELSGPIPTELCEIDDLKALALNTNELTGFIPRCLGEAPILRQLFLSNNKLEGVLPTELCRLANLEQLSVGGNTLIQNVPSCINQLTKLEELRLERNQLDGEIPTALCSLSKLTLLSLGWNLLTGSVPDCFGDLKASEIYVHTNKLSGSIPTTVCRNSGLKAFQVSVNSITGTIPSCLGELDLRILSLNDNLLDGSVPTELGKASNMELLYIDDNVLTGDPTDIFTKFTKATQIFANNNEFSGVLSSSFLASSTNLDYLDLSSNQFTSSTGVPAHLFNLQRLAVLDLSNNLLQGSIEDNMSANNRLGIISLYNNMLSGSVPTTLQQLGLLSHLDISNNSFTGEMPDFLGKMKQLRILFLSENPFAAGPIPSSYVNLKLLAELSIRNTQRNGKFPDYFGELTKLDILDVGNNNLSGSLPPALGNLSLMSYLLLNDNPIDGTVPNTFSKLSDLSAAYFDGTRLSGDLAELCALPNFEDSTVEKGERIIADCLAADGNEAEISCSCCHCCPSEKEGGCSDPDLGNLDIKWEDSFRRQTSRIDFAGENETITVTGDDVLQDK